MKNDNNISEFSPTKNTNMWTVLEETLRDGAGKILQEALQQEIEDFIEYYRNKNKKVVKNGFHPERELQTGIGKLKIKQPRVDDRKIRTDDKIPVFSSKILPRYLRRAPSLDNLIPTLYLKGLSSNDFTTALSAILGDNAKNLSSDVILNLTRKWEKEYKEWLERDLSNKEYAYIWADGIHFNIRMEDSKSIILVIIAADKYGKKELLAIQDGYSESKESWKELLLNLKNRGLTIDPKLAIADGALGFWGALEDVYPTTKHQRCWVHKKGNILSKMAQNKQLQSNASSLIDEIYMSPTKESAIKAFDTFEKIYGEKYPKAIKCLLKDKDKLLTFYEFPAIQWIHIRTSNVVESSFSTVRHRTNQTKGCAKRQTALTMVYKLVKECEKSWSRLKGYKVIINLYQGKKYSDGELVEEVLSAA